MITTTTMVFTNWGKETRSVHYSWASVWLILLGYTKLCYCSRPVLPPWSTVYGLFGQGNQSRWRKWEACGFTRHGVLPGSHWCELPSLDPGWGVKNIAFTLLTGWCPLPLGLRYSPSNFDAQRSHKILHQTQALTEAGARRAAVLKVLIFESHFWPFFWR